MEGFFTKDEYDTTAPRKRVRGCGACKLNRSCNSPNIPPAGEGRRGILVIGGCPGEAEDEQNKPMVGPAGDELRETLYDLDINLDKDCWITYGVTCCTPEDRAPTGMEVQGCRPILLKLIEERKPQLIIPMGKAAVNTLWGERVKEGNEAISKWRGFRVPDFTLGAWVCPTLDPAYIVKQQEEDVSRVIWWQDLTRAFKLLDNPLPAWKDPRECIRMTQDPVKVGKYLKGLLSRDSAVIAHDYETSGIKPHVPGHYIHTIGVSDHPDRAYAFPALPEILPLWKQVLEAPHIRKIAQDMKYEGKWAREIWDTVVQGWVWDTMLCSHVIDNRPNINSLKFQAFVRFGVGDYSSHLRPYMTSPTANGLNHMKEAPMKDLLMYQGMDALLTRRLGYWQMEELGFDIESN